MAAPTSPPFALGPGERLVASPRATSVRRATLVVGRLWLTDRRLYFEPRTPWVFWIAPLVGLIVWLAGRSHRGEVALADLERHARVPFRRTAFMLRLGARDGADYNYIVDGEQAFVATLAELPAFTSKLIPTT